MIHTIGILQGKGGAGRSTVSTNLAGELSKLEPTALIDADLPQATASSWAALRHAVGKMGTLTIASAADHRALVAQRERLAKSHRFIVIDTPPRNGEITRAILMIAAVVVVPVGPSVPDLWATADLLTEIEEARQRRPQLETRLIWNRMRARTRSSLELPTEAGAELKVTALESRLGYRVAYSEALGRGLTVAELGDQTARQELEALVREIITLLT